MQKMGVCLSNFTIGMSNSLGLLFFKLLSLTLLTPHKLSPTKGCPLSKSLPHNQLRD